MRVKSLSSCEDGASVQAHQEPPLLPGVPPGRRPPEGRRINSRSQGETAGFVLEFSKKFKQIETKQQFTFSPSCPSSPRSPASPTSPCFHKKSDWNLTHILFCLVGNILSVFEVPACPQSEQTWSVNSPWPQRSLRLHLHLQARGHPGTPKVNMKNSRLQLEHHRCYLLLEPHTLTNGPVSPPLPRTPLIPL